MSDVITLVGQGGPTSIHIDVRIDDNGDLVIFGQDIGDAPDEIYGDLDFEYWLSIPAAEKDRVLLLLIEKLYRGNAAVVSEFRNFLASKDISHAFHSF